MPPSYARASAPALALVNTSDASFTKSHDIEAFNRLNDPASPHRVILLVNKGTEGWNCPSLFACALARRLRSSNNFVLQAATRCLRQVPGNSASARIYLSSENHGILDRQLQETYGEQLADLDRATQQQRRATLVVRKVDIPPILVRKHIRTVARKMTNRPASLSFERPSRVAVAGTKRILTFETLQSTRRVLQQVGESVEVETMPSTLDAYSAAVELAASRRLDVITVLDALRSAYGTDEVPESDLPTLLEQIDRKTARYEVHEEPVEVALALVRLEGFAREEGDGGPVYTAQIAYPWTRNGTCFDGRRTATGTRRISASTTRRWNLTRTPRCISSRSSLRN